MRKALQNHPEILFREELVFGQKMNLETREFIDRELLFYPQLVDPRERATLAQVLQPGDTFLDLGANIGLYSLWAAQKVGESGRVLAIEADLKTFGKLKNNIELNPITQIVALNCGVSDGPMDLPFQINTIGNRGANSFAASPTSAGETVMVSCRSLWDIMREQKIERVKAAKMDIEGFESRVLTAFFREAPRSAWPDYWLLELHFQAAPDNANACVSILQNAGYTIKDRLSSANYWVELQGTRNES